VWGEVSKFNRGFTAQEKRSFDRWKREESLKAIGTSFLVSRRPAIYFLVAPHGWIRPADGSPSGH